MPVLPSKFVKILARLLAFFVCIELFILPPYKTKTDAVSIELSGFASMFFGFSIVLELVSIS